MAPLDFVLATRKRWALLGLVLGAVTCAVRDDDPGSAFAPETAENALLAESAPARARVEALRRHFPGHLRPSDVPLVTRGDRVEAEDIAKVRAGVALPQKAFGPVEVRDGTGEVAVAFALERAGGLPVGGAWATAGDGIVVHALRPGTDVLRRVGMFGTEDFVAFDTRPAEEEVRYRLDVRRASGLHLLRRTLEVLDARGVPRLRMHPPYVIGADGIRREARVDVSGCAVDRSPGAAWTRPPTPPGADSCELRIAWENVAYPALLDPEWKLTATQMAARRDHTSTLLPNGDVLIAGGFDPAGNALDTAEIFCPPENCGLGVFGQTIPGTLAHARGGHTATRLDATRVLLVGGRSSAGGAILGSAEIYDIDTLGFADASTQPAVARAEHTATLLADGRVLIAGGVEVGSAEIFDPVTGFDPLTISMAGARRGHMAELVGNLGKVLIAGGIRKVGPNDFALSSATLFDPVTNTFTGSINNMTSVRAFGAAARLDDGSVLITGGQNEIGVTFETAEIYDSAADAFVPSLIQMKKKRAFHTATALLGLGRVLLTGGDDGTGTRQSNTEVFDLEATPQKFTLSSEMNVGRSHHAATLLGTGQVLVTGGEDLAATDHYGELLLRKNGEVCESDRECASSICISENGGICCDTECDNICERCFHAKDAPENGTCQLVPAGSPTLSGCKNAIEFHLICDAHGEVTLGDDVTDCGAYACKTDHCRTDDDGCASNADCSATGYCAKTGRCLDKQDESTSCGDDDQCKSGHCVDTFCCDTACEGQCEACNVAPDLGKCSQVVGDPHGARTPCDATGSECEGTCGGNPKKCDYESRGCGDSTCSEGKLSGGICGAGTDGKWACTEGGKSCDDYACNEAGTDCLTECSSTEHCAEGRVCTPAGACIVVHETACDLEHTLVSPDGTSRDCSPYKCRDVSCIERCKTVDDCVEPNVCDEGGRCVAPPKKPSAPSGCQFEGGSDPPFAGALFAALAAFAMGIRRRRLRGVVAFFAALGVVVPGPLLAQPSRPAAEPGADPEARSAPDPKKREEAKVHFDRGLKLLREDAWQAALAEFIRSRELFPTRSATINAGVVLRKLERFDEALDMFESALRDFSGHTPAEKQASQKAVAELRELVGTIDVAGSVPGATIVVDGKNRADYPLVDPLRVGAGTHTVRVFKAGFEAFESRVEVAGGQTMRVVAALRPLRASGRLRVSESGGKRLEVVVDGALVGVTPWDGTLSPGTHAVLLRGDEDWGTPPASAVVKANETTNLNLAAKRLESQLVVDVVPAGAEITVDTVRVGNGVWDGRLAMGAHRVEAKAEGFFARGESLSLERGDLKKLTLKLERDEDAVKWKKPSRVKLDLAGGFALAPAFGGDVAKGCTGACSQGLGMGGTGKLNATYEFGSGFGIGLAAGYLQMVQDISNRPTTVNPTGLPASRGTSSDQLGLRGVLFGASASFGRDLTQRLPALVRLGVGGLIGSARDVRSGTFATRAGSSVVLPEAQSDSSAAFLTVDPEVKLGVRLTEHLEIDVGFDALFLVAVKKPRWGDEKNPAFVLGGDGYSTYAKDALVSDLTVVLVPELGARYTF